MMKRRGSYLLSALLLASGAPLGLALLRTVRAGEVSWSRARRDVAADLSTYAYVTLSTTVVFVAFGYVLGRRADQLYELSSTDPLTGLHNRRVVQERLEEEMGRALRYGSALSVLLVDIDGLKELNDRHGHRAGDAALRNAAAAIRDGSRATDVAARWGGDEFMLLAPNTGPPEARQLAERIRALTAEGTVAPPVTVSVGIAALEAADAGVAEAVVRRADRALYEAKRLGRNRVASA
jgi:diguanylate cyclase (GGDEF)-like protein